MARQSEPCNRPVRPSDVYGDKDINPTSRARFNTITGATSGGNSPLAPAVIALMIEQYGANDISYALELKAILDDFLLYASSDSGYGSLTPADSNVDSIKSSTNPDAFKVTHLTTGYSTWIPGTILNFTDKYTPSYNKEMVYGRMDPIATYAHTTRAISFDWEVDTGGGGDAYALGSVSDLVKFMYPFYEGSSLKGSPTLAFRFLNVFGPAGWEKQHMASPGAQATVLGGGRSDELICIVDDFSLSGLDNTAQGANMLRAQMKGSTSLIPQVYTLSFSLTPIHDSLPIGWRHSSSRYDFAGNEALDAGMMQFPLGQSWPYGFGSTLPTSMKEADGRSKAQNAPVGAGAQALIETSQQILGDG